MKKKNFFMLAIAAIAFAACSNDDLVPVENPGDKDELVSGTDGDAWVALTIKSTSSLTRGLKEPEKQENATEAEAKINVVRAIFFTAEADEDDATVTADILLTNDEAGIGSDGLPTGGAGVPFKVPATSKRILIVANPTSDFATPSKTKWDDGTTYKVVNAVVTKTAADVANTTTGFMMSNAKGSLEPSIMDENDTDFGKPTDLSLYTTEAAATRNPLSIRIDRVVAKVRVYITTTSESKAAIKNAGWVLSATNKTFYPVSIRTLTWNENPNNTGARGTCITPFDIYKHGSYRIDPNYDTQDVAYYNYLKPAVDASTWKKDKEYDYCLENTQTARHNMNAYTTHVLFKAQFIPTEYGLPGGGTVAGDPNTPTDWMYIDGGYYTYATLMQWIEAELKNKYDDPTPATFPTLRTTLFNRYLGAEGINVGSITLPATADDAAIALLVQEFKDKETAVLNTPAANRAKKVGNFTYYVNAVSYYMTMIRHDDTSAISNELGEFGVVRNSVYDINVKKFNNPGYPIIPDPGTDVPDETDEGWLAIEIITNPWTWYTQDVEF